MTIAVQTTSVRDADQYAAMLRPIGRLVVTGRGPFRADLARLHLGGLMLQQADVSQPMVAELNMPSQAVVGFGDGAGVSEAWEGTPLRPGNLVVHRPGSTVKLAGYGRPWGSLTLSTDTLAELADTALGAFLPDTAGGLRMVAPPPAAMARLRRLHAQAFRAAATPSGPEG